MKSKKLKLLAWSVVCKLQTKSSKIFFENVISRYANVTKFCMILNIDVRKLILKMSNPYFNDWLFYRTICKIQELPISRGKLGSTRPLCPFHFAHFSLSLSKITSQSRDSIVLEWEPSMRPVFYDVMGKSIVLSEKVLKTII